MTWLIIAVFLASLAVSLVLTPLSILFSRRLSLLDQPDARKVHTSATPRLGGVGIVGGALLVAVPCFLYLVNAYPELTAHISRQYLGVLLGAVCVFAVGLTDDLSPVSSKLKLVALLGASFAVCGAGGAFGELRSDGALLVAFPWLSWTLTAVWIASFAVAFNFIDGLDGLAGGLGLLTTLVLSVFLLSAGQYAAAIAPLALAGGILGFLYFNWHPAKTFMGDGGSMAVGFLLGALTVVSNPALGTMRAMVIPGFALSVALVDAALTLFRRRYLQRRSMFSAERGHIHHRLIDSGFSHRQAVLVIHAVSLVAVLIGMVSLIFEGWATIGGLCLIVPLLWGLFHAAGSVRTGEMVGALRRKHDFDRTSRKFRQAFETLQLEFDAVGSFSEWWQVVCNAAERLEFSGISLPVGSPSEAAPRTLSWTNPDDDACEEEQIDAKIPVTLFGSSQPSRVASVQIPASVCLESAGQRLALFSRLMAENGKEALRGIHSRALQSPTSKAAAPSGEFGALKVAVVHDELVRYGGPEKVVEQIINVFPHCDLYSLCDFLPQSDRRFLRDKPVTTTFLQGLPFAQRFPQMYLPLRPFAIERLDLSSYDVVVSSSRFAAKGVITRPDQLHICYCHSAFRHGWDAASRQDLHGDNPSPGVVQGFLLHYLRNWDVQSAHRVDQFIANSRPVAQWIEKLYRRKSEIIAPPVDTDTFLPGPSDSAPEGNDYYFTATPLLSHKRVELIVEAFANMPGKRLVVAGDGPLANPLLRMATNNVEFVGQLGGAAMVRHMQNANAFIVAAEEEFGIAAVEALACGTPVIAFAKGGAIESMADCPAAHFFEEQSAESLIQAIERFESAGPMDDLDRKAARQRAERYSPQQFVEQLSDTVRREARRRWPRRMHARNTSSTSLIAVAPPEEAIQGPHCDDDAHTHAQELGND